MNSSRDLMEGPKAEECNPEVVKLSLHASTDPLFYGEVKASPFRGAIYPLRQRDEIFIPLSPTRTTMIQREHK